MIGKLFFHALDPFDTEYSTSFISQKEFVDHQSGFSTLLRNFFKIPSAVCDVTSNCNAIDPTQDFTLVQAQVVLRHGARTPIFTIPNVPEARYAKRIFQAQLAHTDFDFKLHHISGGEAVGFEESPVNKRYNRHLLGGMLLGQLTTVGQQQCYERGLELRRRYVTKHKLLSGQVDETVYMRSTYIARTIESLQCFIAGIFGVEVLNKSSPRFHVAYYNEEMLYPNVVMCDCLRDIARHGLKERRNVFPDNTALISKISEALGYSSSPPLSLVGLRDDLVARDAHSQIIPPQLEPYLELIDKQAAIEFVQAIIGTKEDRSLGLLLAVGPFHHMVLRNMEGAIKGNRLAKLSIYSSHDSMIMPLLVALGNYGWVWPPYASYLSYELWQHNVSKEHHVKVISNGKELTLPGKSNSLIPYPEFQEFLSPVTIGIPGWKNLCSQPKTSIDSPEIEYSIHYDAEVKNCDDDDVETVSAGM